ncbi:hypothetical protein YPPY03_4836, partial [Yersinia pestis PY-03]
MRCTWRG